MCTNPFLFALSLLLHTIYIEAHYVQTLCVLVWHPNVSSVTGAICLDILKDQWSPALTMKTAMLSLQALMCSPEPNDPQDAVVATMYKERQAEFQSTAR